MTFVLSSYRAECDAYSWFVTLGNDDIHPTARVSEWLRFIMDGFISISGNLSMSYRH